LTGLILEDFFYALLFTIGEIAAYVGAVIGIVTAFGWLVS
jgi:hypothetical protein